MRAGLEPYLSKGKQMWYFTRKDLQYLPFYMLLFKKIEKKEKISIQFKCPEKYPVSTAVSTTQYKYPITATERR